MRQIDRFNRAGSVLVILFTMFSLPVPAQADMLGECRALSTAPADVENCMDNFLDLLDRRISDMEILILGELGGLDGQTSAAADAFERSQAAFRNFRRENCLWYLEFSSPRDDAAQIGKSCLAEQSRARYDELQSLVREQPTKDKALSGYYVYGVDRNTFQVCGSTRRYWVEGDTTLVSQLQQDYLNQTVNDLAVLYAVVEGELSVSGPGPYPGHEGVLTLTGIDEVRPPADGDCRLQASSSGADAGTVTDLAAVTPAEIIEPDESTTEESQQEPEQQLKAYFGAWVAECEQLGSSYGCVISTLLEGNDLEDDERPKLELTRRSRKRTIIDLDFPGQEIDSIEKIIWGVDTFEVGTLDASRIRVDDVSARQEVRDRPLIQDTLLPLLAKGNKVVIQVDDEGESVEYSGTLVGLSRAVAFSDDFTAADGKI